MLMQNSGWGSRKLIISGVSQTMICLLGSGTQTIIGETPSLPFDVKMCTKLMGPKNNRNITIDVFS